MRFILAKTQTPYHPPERQHLYPPPPVVKLGFRRSLLLADPAPEQDVELRETTRELLAEVEQTTGFQAVVTEDRTLTMTSGVVMAAWDRPSHLIRIHPKVLVLVDYYVVYHCRTIQRFFENPPEERFLFGVGEKGRYHFRKMMERLPFAKRMGEAALTPLVTQLLTGFMTHLRSVPLGLRLDDWIFSEHPELVEMQRAAIQPQLQENNRTADDQYRRVCPPPVFDATMAINAALAQFWAEKWNQPELTVPYMASGHAGTGTKLLNCLHDIPDSGRTDRALIDAWGAELKVSDWYAWVPYRNPQGR